MSDIESIRRQMRGVWIHEEFPQPKQECPHNKCTNNKGDRCILIARLYEECNEVLGKCPECGGPATHPSGLCRDCHQGKLEAEDP